LIEFPLILADK